MFAFIFAGLIELVTVALALLALFAAGMSDAPTQASGAGQVFAIGTGLAALVAASHWVPWGALSW